MRGAAPWQITQGPNLRISTHAPHARRGHFVKLVQTIRINFYSRASCEARPCKFNGLRALKPFLLTRLMRGAAQKGVSRHSYIKYFYSRASCEARRPRLERQTEPRSISTHAPHARRGFQIKVYARKGKDFYSRASCEARHPLDLGRGDYT